MTLKSYPSALMIHTTWYHETMGKLSIRITVRDNQAYPSMISTTSFNYYLSCSRDGTLSYESVTDHLGRHQIGWSNDVIELARSDLMKALIEQEIKSAIERLERVK